MCPKHDTQNQSKSPKMLSSTCEQGCCGQSILAVASTDKHIGLNSTSVSAGTIVFQAGQVLPPGAVHLGDRAIIAGAGGNSICLKRVPQDRVGTMESRDFMVLDTKFDAQGTRRLEFAEAVSKMSQITMPGGGLQLDGPASSLEVLRSWSLAA